MKFNTTRFGEIDVDENLIFNFELPVLGYDDKKYILIDVTENPIFKWVQSLETPEISFPVTTPALFGHDYVFELPTHAEELLEIKTAEDVLVFNIACIPGKKPQDATINLLAPLIFNTKNHKAGQVILADSGFKTREKLFIKN